MEVDKYYLLLTMTFYWVGKVVRLTPTDIVITDAAQVFDAGELSESLKTGEVRLCQAIPSGVNVTVPRAGTTALDWPHKLLRTSKRD